MYSCDVVQRSVTLDGIAFGLFQMMSCRKYQPASWSANATRHGIPMRSFGFKPSGVDLWSVPMIVPSEVACLEFGSTFAEPSEPA